MEEKKTKQTEKSENQKLTYEQLNNICGELYQQNQNLTRQLQQANIATMFKRLDYLFKTLEFAHVIKDEEFIANCVDEIKAAMTVKEEESQEE